LASRTNLRLVFAAILLAGYWCALFVATHVPLPAGLPGAGLDKLYHAVAYAGLALLLSTVWSLWRRPSWKSYFLVLATIAAYGLLDEWGQMHVPGRSADVKDWIADLIGGVIGVTLHWIGAALIAAISGGVATPLIADALRSEDSASRLTTHQTRSAPKTPRRG
jgi:VanZ family protein